jgi:hypothetical protein
LKSAGYWIYGACLWIGSGWCRGTGPHRRPEGQGEGDASVKRQLPQIGAVAAGTGVHRKIPHVCDKGVGVNRQLPHAGKGPVGINRKIPHVASKRGVNRAPGVNRQLPAALHSGVATARGGCADRREFILSWLEELADRMRGVRMCCGDWSRVVTPAVTTDIGLTGVFLDPPYDPDECCNVYAQTDQAVQNVARDVLAWAVANGDNPMYRIALCGYEGQYALPDTWSAVRWSAAGGYGNQGNGRGRENAKREVIHFSPHCIKPSLGGLFGAGDDDEELEPIPEEEEGEGLFATAIA